MGAPALTGAFFLFCVLHMVHFRLFPPIKKFSLQNKEGTSLLFIMPKKYFALMVTPTIPAPYPKWPKKKEPEARCIPSFILPLLSFSFLGLRTFLFIPATRYSFLSIKSPPLVFFGSCIDGSRFQPSLLDSYFWPVPPWETAS